MLTPHTTPSDRAFRSICGACGAKHSADAWKKLALVEQMSPARVAEVVAAWPANVAIEVRRCDGCGATIARMVTTR